MVLQRRRDQRKIVVDKADGNQNRRWYGHRIECVILNVLVEYGTANREAVLTQAFATNGAKVYITGRRMEVLETTAKVHGSAEKLGEQGGSIVPLQMDTTDKKSISAAVELITKNEGYLNVYVNNDSPWRRAFLTSE